MFVQIQEVALNADHIVRVDFRDEFNTMTVYMLNGYKRDFIGDEADAFRKWWEEKAEVYKAL